MSYKISIILPVFNVEDFIRDALESIIKQTIGFKDLEVIMVDDCSTDKSGEIIDEYADRYDNFKAIHLTENSGPERARNEGINSATGQYLMFLDPDDFYSDDICEVLYNKIVEEQVDIVFCNFNFYSNGDYKKNGSVFGSKDEIRVNSIDNNPKLLTIHPSVWTKIYKRDFIQEKEIRFKEDVRAGDRVFVLKTFFEADGIIYLQKYYGTNYRINITERDSFSNEITKEVLMGRLRGYAEIVNQLKAYKREKYFPLIFSNIREFWLDRFIKSDSNLLEKKDMLEEARIFFEEYEKYNISISPRKKYLIPLINHIVREEYDEAILLTNDLKDFIQKFDETLSSKKEFDFLDKVGDKKIFSISMVKNEMDIIESFIRYNANIFDGMIILDNGSTDYTPVILSFLENEGLPIYVFDDEDSEFDKIAKMNMLLRKAVNEFNADIVVPLDADEFIMSSEGGNPRIFLGQIEPNTYNSAMWKTYIPFIGNKDYEKFIPAKITYRREDKIEKRVGVHTKVIIPQNLVKQYDVRVDRGSHNLTFNHQYKSEITRVYNDNLRIAHFPIRSIEQVTSKVAVGWLNALSSVELGKFDSHHWKKMFYQLKRNGKIELEDALKFSSEYALSKVTLAEFRENNVDIIPIEDPMDLSFCEDTSIRYFKQLNPISNILDTSEKIASSYVNLKKDVLKGKTSQNDRVSKNEVHQTKMDMNNEKSFKQKIISNLPRLYILFNRNNGGLKNTFVNLKGYKIIKDRNLVDENFYLKNYGDVRVSGMDPTLHYMYHGYKEGRNPNPSFKSGQYLKMHSDVKRSKLNPLVHYSLYGMKEGRKISRPTKSNKKRTKSTKKPVKPSIKKKTISIKVPAPNWEVAHTWGDYHFALALKKEFNIKGYETKIHMANQWNKDDDADVVLVLRGRVKYNPKPNNFNIMWNISHPEMVSLEEYNQYDHVFIASNKYANEIKSKVNVPVEPLIQCTDPDLFYPEYSSQYEHELLFVGNNRKNVVRNIIRDLLPTEKDFCIYGDHWDGRIDPKYHCGRHIPNNELHKAYHSCKILLNDHWDEMSENGFISNRIFDAFAAGAFIISDEIKAGKELFGDALVTYSNKDDLNRLIDYYLENYDETKKIVEKGRNIVLNGHTFKNRAKSILDVIPTDLNKKSSGDYVKLEAFLSAFVDSYWKNQDRLEQSIKNIEEGQVKIEEFIENYQNKEALSQIYNENNEKGNNKT